MLKYIIAIAIAIVVVGIYIWSYKLNEKTEKPEGCEEISCSGCNVDNCVSRR
ncbi:MAG: hypothetical protein WC152_05295 [Candidatus Izemoplasmatales bacterium]